MRIFLVGYMGSGKSRWGKQLAKKLNVDFIDLDKQIEQQQGLSIPEIFEQNGESYFRKIEHQVLCSVLRLDNVIVATGGGTPCYGNNMELMNTHSTTIYLQAEPGILVNRLLNAKNKRPLVKDMERKELLNYIRLHLKSRMSFYMQADHIVDVTNLTISQLINVLY